MRESCRLLAGTGNARGIASTAPYSLTPRTDPTYGGILMLGSGGLCNRQRATWASGEWPYPPEYPRQQYKRTSTPPPMSFEEAKTKELAEPDVEGHYRNADQ